MVIKVNVYVQIPRVRFICPNCNYDSKEYPQHFDEELRIDKVIEGKATVNGICPECNTEIDFDLEFKHYIDKERFTVCG